MKKSTPVLWLLLSFVLLMTQSCIDNKYDLDNLPDKLLVAGDSIVLPLGTADKLFMNEFLGDQNIDNLEEIDNVFYLIQSGSIDLSLPTGDLNINNPNPISNKVVTKPSDISILDNVWIPTSDPRIPAITGSTEALAINQSNSTIIKRIDRAIFKAGSTLNIKIDLKGTIFSKEVFLLVDIPSGLSLKDQNGAVIQLTNGKYSISIPAGTSSLVKTLNIASLDNSNEIKFNYSVDFNASNIKYLSSSPEKSLALTIQASGLNVDTFYGLISYTGSKPGISTNLSSLYSDLFKNPSDTISLYNPQLIIDTETNFGIPFSADLSVSGVTNGVPFSISGGSTQTQIHMDAPTNTGVIKTNHFEIGNDKLNFSNIIKYKPDIVNVNVSYASNVPGDWAGDWGAKNKPHFISSSSTGKIGYKFKIPMAFAKDFILSYADTLEDVFEDEINDVLFSTGEVELKGTVVSTIPLNATLKIKILTENNELIEVANRGDITFNKANPAQSESPISIILSSNILKGKKAKDLIAEFTLKSASDIEGIAIKSTDYVLMKDIRIVKRGGLSLDLK